MYKWGTPKLQMNPSVPIRRTHCYLEVQLEAKIQQYRLITRVLKVENPDHRGDVLFFIGLLKKTVITLFVTIFVHQTPWIRIFSCVVKTIKGCMKTSSWLCYYILMQITLPIYTYNCINHKPKS